MVIARLNEKKIQWYPLYNGNDTNESERYVAHFKMHYL